jgi:phosphogluconate dehydratase
MTIIPINPTLSQVTDRIIRRSRTQRQAYLARTRAAAAPRPRRAEMACSNLAHGMAACASSEKAKIRGTSGPCIAIVSAYNDMLSAHQPFESFPALIKRSVAEAGGVARFAGGVPAMCDGVTQGMAGMELSLFSRDVIATATAVALSHDLFDGVLLLGVCDKIVPGLVIGALTFGHLPMILVPAGPMPTGIGNSEKAKVRQAYAKGEATREDLLTSEAAAYHAPGTCTFYGTANSNQMLMEFMGLHLPGASFVPPNTPLRDAYTKAAAERVTALFGQPGASLAETVDERSFVNGIVGLLATGGSTNHTLHLLAMAAAAGILLDWEDFHDLARVIPLITRVYPSGLADVNQFHQAGGLAAVIGSLLAAGLLHGDIKTVQGGDFSLYAAETRLSGGQLQVGGAAAASRDPAIIASVAAPFSADGGLATLGGNLGRAVAKTSAVKPEFHSISAPCLVFASQEEVEDAFRAGALHRDVVCVVRFQGPRANGMPELHKLTPLLGVLQDLGYKVALVTDGRMSGASGKVLSAIHVTPEALDGGSLARISDGDVIRIDTARGLLEVALDADELAARPAASPPRAGQWGTGRELFAPFRQLVSPADRGASIFAFDGQW